MSRVADSTIKGFLYQFNLTAVEVLNLDFDEEICVEGMVEDIDIIKKWGTTAIQCKYHESKEKFELSSIYKPVLQMLKTFSLCGDSKIKFILYAYFPNEIIGEKNISESDIETILNTTNINYICQYIAYIRECKDDDILQLVQKEHKTNEEKSKIKEYFIKNELPLKCNISSFLESHFKFIIGNSYEDTCKVVKQKLEIEGFQKEDIEELFYPNTIQRIAEVSVNKNETDRVVNKAWLIEALRKTKHTAITRWTRELKSYKKLLYVRRKQLSANLNYNRRKRCFIINSEEIDTFDENIVMLIVDYISKYCSKVKLHIPATFCILGYTKEKLDSLIARIYKKGIRCENGYQGNCFFKEAFVREPKVKQNESWMEFQVKLCIGCTEIYEIISANKPEDIFILSSRIPEKLDLKDMNVEKLEINRIEELEYLLKLKDEVPL